MSLCASMVSSSRVRPPANMAEMRAMGKPVAFEAKAEDRDVRGLISMDHHASGPGIVCELDVRAANDLNGLHDGITSMFGGAFGAPGQWSALAQCSRNHLCAPPLRLRFR